MWCTEDNHGNVIGTGPTHGRGRGDTAAEEPVHVVWGALGTPKGDVLPHQSFTGLSWHLSDARHSGCHAGGQGFSDEEGEEDRRHSQQLWEMKSHPRATLLRNAKYYR